MPLSRSFEPVSPADTGPGVVPGHRVVRLGDVASTNAEVLGLAAQGEAHGLWVTAVSQNSGRGRGGRVWSSPPGNLYASVLLRPDCPLGDAQQLSLLAPVALFDAVAALFASTGRAPPTVRLKWPNDLLVDGAKVSGILLESAFAGRNTYCIAAGFGLNLASHPEGLDQAATHLAAHGCSATPDQALAALSWSLSSWLERWADGAGFDAIHRAWIERAGPLGEPLRVRISHDPAVPRLEGRYAGLDPSGALLLDHADGTRSRHIQGDVALGGQDR